MPDPYFVAGLGELLWDLLPDGKELGGAPVNFARVAALLGNRAAVVSRVGTDELGKLALVQLRQLGVYTEFVQEDELRATGTVAVTLDALGQPAYSAHAAVAWDHLQWTEQWQVVAGRLDGVCFGSLGQRSVASRETIMRFVSACSSQAVVLFDINLRHSFFDEALLNSSLRAATAVKLNEDEVGKVGELLSIDCKHRAEFARRLLDLYDLDLVAITFGAAGSVIATKSGMEVHKGFQVSVVDTVGAGDGFGAALVHALLHQLPLDQTSELANRVGAWMVTQRGGTPTPVDTDFMQMIYGL
jgi:fructokinase